MPLKISAVLSVSVLLGVCVSGCTGIASRPIDSYSSHLESYFAAKKEFAESLQSALSASTDRNQYRLVSINGPAYRIGTLLSPGNALDVVSRECTLADDQLPAGEAWTGFPKLKKTSVLSLDLGVAAPPQFNDALVDLRDKQSTLDFDFSNTNKADYQIVDLSQKLLARAEVENFLRAERCAPVVEQLQGSATLVRGIVEGREILNSSRTVDSNTDASVLLGPNSTFSFDYDSNGSFSLTESVASPKFYVLTNVLFTPIVVRGEKRFRIAYSVPTDKQIAELLLN